MRAICAAAFLIFLDLITVINSGAEKMYNMICCKKKKLYLGGLIVIVFVDCYLECAT
jgi:hypothetical protein